MKSRHKSEAAAVAQQVFSRKGLRRKYVTNLCAAISQTAHQEEAFICELPFAFILFLVHRRAC